MARNARGPRMRSSERTVAFHVDRMGRWQTGLSRVEDASFMDEERTVSISVPGRRMEHAAAWCVGIPLTETPA